jgi:hypothetical protein
MKTSFQKILVVLYAIALYSLIAFGIKGSNNIINATNITTVNR